MSDVPPVAPAVADAPVVPATPDTPVVAAPDAPAPADPPVSALADWRAGITDPEHLEFAKRTASVADLAKVALDMRKANSSMVRVPGADAKPEDVQKFRKAIGVPDKAEEYEFDLGREATDADKVVQSSIAKVMFDNGVPKSAVKAVSKAVADLAAAQFAEQDRVAVKARDEATASLRKEMGADYDGNLALASRALKVFGGEQIDSLLNTVVNGAKLGDHPELIRAFVKVGRRMGEGEFIGAIGTTERASVQERINALMTANPPGTEKYKDAAVQRELAALHIQLHGEAPAAGFGGRLV